MITRSQAITIMKQHKKGLGAFVAVREYKDLMSTIFWFAKGSISVAMTDGRCVVHKDS